MAKYVIIEDQSGKFWFIDLVKLTTRPAVCGGNDAPLDLDRVAASRAHASQQKASKDLGQVLRELGSSKERGSNYANMIATLTHVLLIMKADMQKMSERLAALENILIDDGR